MRGQYYRRRYRRRDRRGNKGQDVSGRSMSILILLGLVAFFAILLSDKSNAPVLIGLLIIGVFCGVIYFFHQSRNLSDTEVSELVKVRRNRSIRAYYDFDTSEYNVDKRFKKNMAANGSFYNIDIRLRDFPATVAALLKYKKHEWAIVAFERNGIVDRLYTHCLDILPTEDRWFLSICYGNPNYIRGSWPVNYLYNTLALFSVEMRRVR